jgi:hypothetical protein
MENKLRNCMCGNNAIAWGIDRVENHNYVHCSKCNRYVQAETKRQAAKLWNAPLNIPESKNSIAKPPIGHGIY